MTADEQRHVENFAIMCPLEHIEDTDMLAFLATLIQDHEHMREKLETEPDYDKKREKLEAMRSHLKFRALPLSVYISNSAAKQCGVQPIYAGAGRAVAYRLCQRAGCMLNKNQFAALAATTKTGKPSGEQVAMNGGMKSGGPSLKGESHSYDFSRPKRQVVSRYSK